MNQRFQYLIRFSYRGDNFFGLEPQKNVPTAGAALFNALASQAGNRPRALQFSARTDKGVHALQNLATCWFQNPLSLAGEGDFGSPKSGEGVTWHPHPVPKSTHARAISTAKHYRYVIEDNCPFPCPPNPFAWQIAPTLDPQKIQAAAQYLVGEHDFSSFRASGCTAASPIKTIQQITVHGPIPLRFGRRQFHIDIVGTAFLRKMVRNMVGALVEVGTGLRQPQEIAAILEAKNRHLAGLTAPPQGLTLMQVILSPEVLFLLA